MYSGFSMACYLKSPYLMKEILILILNKKSARLNHLIYLKLERIWQFSDLIFQKTCKFFYLTF